MKTSKLSIKLAILLYSLVQTGTILISSILARIAELYPEYSATTIQFLMTFPCLVIIIMSLLLGKIVEFVPKKVLALFSASLFVVTAFGGFFFHDSLLILFFWEIILGIAIGILATLGSSLVADHFKGEERSSMMGMQSAIISVGGVILSLLGGLLATIDWYYNYLAFLLIIPGFILLLIGLPMDKPLHETGKNKKRTTVNIKIVLFYGVISFLLMLLFGTIPANLAMHLKENNILGSVNAGTASAVLMFSGVLAGLLYKTISRFLGERVIVLGFFNIALGSLLTGIAESYWIILVGVFIAGFSLSLVMAQVVMSVAEKENPTVLTTSIAYIMAINNCGSFLSPYFTKISKAVMGNDTAASRYVLVSILAFMTTAALFAVLRKSKNEVIHLS